MKKIHVVLCLLFFVTLKTAAQTDGIIGHERTINTNGICLKWDSKEGMKWIEMEEKKHNPQKIRQNQIFSFRGFDECDVYAEWQNPLNFRIEFKDSAIIDDRELALLSMLDILAPAFGANTTEGISDLLRNQIEEADDKAMKDRKSDLQSRRNKSDNSQAKGQYEPVERQSLSIRKKGLKDFDLIVLYLHLTENEDSFGDKAIEKINHLTDTIVRLDSISRINYQEYCKNSIARLKKINSAKMVDQTVKQIEQEIIAFTNGIQIAKRWQKNILKDLAEISLSNELLDIYFNTVVSNFVRKSEIALDNADMLVKRLNPILNLFQKSIGRESIDVKDNTYYKISNVDFADDKMQLCKFSISASTVSVENGKVKISSDSTLVSTSFTMRKYSRVTFSASTGLFIANTTLTGYGVGNNSSSKLVVTEDAITKNTPGAAVFMNANIQLDRFFAPGVQLGIDPTKKKSYILGGLAIAFPSLRCAVSGGLLWTRNATLNKLIVGQEIQSTTDLENDITYTFDVKPKGYYFGLQFNLGPVLRGQK